MKWLLSIIIALNVLVFGYGQLKPVAQGAKPEPELNADKITLLPPNWVPVRNEASEPLIAEASTPAEEKPVALCYQWGKFNDRLLARVKGGLPTLQLADKQMDSSASDEKPATQSLVYYPALPTVEDTNQMAMDLAAGGFPSSVVASNPGRGNLSLGLFSDESNAKRLEKRVKSAGFDRVRIAEREDDNKKTAMTLLSFNQLDKKQAEKLKALQQHLTPGIRVKETPCETTRQQP